jgi:hypothetical protein
MVKKLLFWFMGVPFLLLLVALAYDIWGREYFTKKLTAEEIAQQAPNVDITENSREAVEGKYPHDALRLKYEPELLHLFQQSKAFTGRSVKSKREFYFYVHSPSRDGSDFYTDIVAGYRYDPVSGILTPGARSPEFKRLEHEPLIVPPAFREKFLKRYAEVQDEKRRRIVRARKAEKARVWEQYQKQLRASENITVDPKTGIGFGARPTPPPTLRNPRD